MSQLWLTSPFAIASDSVEHFEAHDVAHAIEEWILATSRQSKGVDMRILACWMSITVVMSLSVQAPSLGAGQPGGDSDLLKVYEVNKRVTDFPDAEDFSTPEAAYALINRVMAHGEEAAWRRISVQSLADRLPPADAATREVHYKNARMWMSAVVLEVRTFRGTHGAVIAKIARPSGEIAYDLRSVELASGRWLNCGQRTLGTMDEARSTFAALCAPWVDKPVRPKVKDPDAHLRTFVEFLKASGEEPKSFVMAALARHRLVIMGEVHHRPRYWSFNSSLVTDPAFAKTVGVIYMELPANDQALIDEFLAADKLDTKPVVEMLRDMQWMGSPGKPMLDFFVTVWRVNQNLPVKNRLRIVLADMPRPWRDIRKREDWRKYEVPSRDRQMADNIERDLRRHAEDERHALFIVGAGHTMLNLEHFEGAPMHSAGHFLMKELGRDHVYAFFPHMYVGTNMGRVDGRLCLGLFDTAFAALGHKPMAFPLGIGPFGEQPFDALADWPVISDYRDGYDAYLYLGPLKDEVFSPLIPGFYTDEFVEEVDRRHRLSFSMGLVESSGLDRLDGASFTRLLEKEWGQPRRSWRDGLGPISAWRDAQGADSP